MANTFKDISQFTLKSAATGTEEFQVSATEKVTAQQIADLASSGLNVYTISESESQNQKIDASRVEELKKSAIVLFPNEVGYTPYFKVSTDDSKAYFITGIIPINSQGQPGINNGEEPPFEQVQTVMIEVDLTTRDITVWPYPVVKKEWLQTSDVIEVGDFTTINEVWPASVEQTPGNVVSFYTGAEVYSQPEASETKYVGFVILDTDFANTKTATVIAYGQNTGKQYIGKLEYEAQSIDWYPLTYASRLTNAVKVTAFTESSLSSLLSSWKAGDVVPFTTDSVTASTANQFPESGIFNGFISMGSNEGDYCQIFAFKSGSTKAYLGACIGSTTQWTTLGGGGGMEKISNWSDSRYVNANEDAGISETVNFPLTRALKSTDIVLVTWRKENASGTNAEIAGHAIFHPGAYSQDVGLEVVEDFQDSTNYYGLFMNQTETEIGSTSLNMYGVSQGPNAYGPHYLITGIYNLSGQ